MCLTTGIVSLLLQVASVIALLTTAKNFWQTAKLWTNLEDRHMNKMKDEHKMECCKSLFLILLILFVSLIHAVVGTCGATIVDFRNDTMQVSLNKISRSQLFEV